MTFISILRFYYSNYLHFNKVSFVILVLLSIITGILNGISLYLVFGFIQYLSSKNFDNEFFNTSYLYVSQLGILSKTNFFLLVIFVAFTLKIVFNGLYFIKAELFRINVSFYLSQLRIKKSESNIVSDLTVHLTKADTFNDLLLSMILQVSSNVFSIFILFSLNLLATLSILLVVAPVIYFTSKYFTRNIIEFVSIYNRKLYEYTDYLVTYKNQFSNNLDEFKLKNREIKSVQLKVARFRFLSTNFYEFIFFLIIYLLLIVDVSNKVIYLGVLVKIISNFQSIIQYNQKIQIRYESFKKFFE